MERLSFVTDSTDADQDMTHRSVRISFSVVCYTSYGDSVSVVGNTRELGRWAPSLGHSLKTDSESYPVWSSSLYLEYSELPMLLEYKYVIMSETSQWERFTNNRSIEIPCPLPSNFLIEVHETFNNFSCTRAPELSLSPVMNQLIYASLEKTWRGKIESLNSFLIQVPEISLQELFYMSSFLKYIYRGSDLVSYFTIIDNLFFLRTASNNLGIRTCIRAYCLSNQVLAKLCKDFFKLENEGLIFEEKLSEYRKAIANPYSNDLYVLFTLEQLRISVIKAMKDASNTCLFYCYDLSLEALSFEYLGKIDCKSIEVCLVVLCNTLNQMLLSGILPEKAASIIKIATRLQKDINYSILKEVCEECLDYFYECLVFDDTEEFNRIFEEDMTDQIAFIFRPLANLLEKLILKVNRELGIEEFICIQRGNCSEGVEVVDCIPNEIHENIGALVICQRVSLNSPVLQEIRDRKIPCAICPSFEFPTHDFSISIDEYNVLIS